MAAPNATLQDDLSVMAEKEDDKGETRRQRGNTKRKAKSNTGSNRDPASGPGNGWSREAAVGAGRQTQQCPDSRFVCKTPEALPWFPKEQMQPAP